MSYFDDVVEPRLTRGLPYAGSYRRKEITHVQKEYIVYTDGACSNNQEADNRVGAFVAAIFTSFNGKTYKKDITGIVPGATNNQMELMGVLEGLKEITRLSPEMPKVTVISDSNYVISGINQWLKDWKAKGWKTKSNDPVKNQPMWAELDSLLTKVSLKLEKVAGDNSVKWNRYCDVEARKLCGSAPKRRSSK